MCKAFSVLVLLILLMGTLKLAVTVQPVKTEPISLSMNDGGLAGPNMIQETLDKANPRYTVIPPLKDLVIQAKESDLANRLTAKEVNGFRASVPQFYLGSLPNETEQTGSSRVDQDPAKLAIGLDEAQPNGYSEIANIIASRGGKLVDTVAVASKIGAVVADIPRVALSAFVAEIKDAGLSRYVESDMAFKADFVPNDPDWSKQWGPRTIQADYAWNTTIGSASVLVAVVDTGIDYSHPDLAANYVPLGYNWVNNDTNPMDDNGHGTHCAGIIAAVLDNNVGIAGLAQVRVMAEKVLNNLGMGYYDWVASGIVHATDMGANIISMSLGGYGDSQLVHDAVMYAYQHGVLLVAAAGNDNTERKHYPAAYKEVVAVTATDNSDSPAWFTDFGNWIELAAPGVDVYSTYLNNGYQSLSGTSMAVPHVAGVAALIWSQFPNMTRDQVRVQLRRTADDLGNLGFDEFYGYGRINAKNAVTQPLPEHDLDLQYWNAPYVLKPFDTETINGTLLNFGANNESDITVQLLVNGSVAASESITYLASGASFTVSCVWNPTAEGKYNVTLYVVPVAGEVSTENNLLSEYVIVRSSEIVTVPGDFQRIQEAIDEVSAGYTVQVAPGTYHEHLVIDKSIALIGENCNTTVVDGDGFASVITASSEQGNVNVTGFTLQNGGLGFYDGGVILFCSGNSISGNKITYCGYGIGIFESANNTITNNIISKSWMGIHLEGSGGNLLENNCMVQNVYNFDISGTTLSDYINDIYPSNTVDGKPIFYLVNQQAKTVPEDAGYVAAINSTEITMKNLNLTNNGEGVLCINVTNSTIASSYASDNVIGFYLQQSIGDVIDGNMAVGNLVGVWQQSSCNANIVNNNSASEGMVGIALTDETSNSNVTDNTVFNNQLYVGIAIDLEYSNNNTFVRNTMENNIVGVYFVSSPCDNNTLYHNNFVKNKYQVIQDTQINVWDDGYPTGGNYWSDYNGTDLHYGPGQNKSGSDGIGDTPYVINNRNIDHCPFVNPIVIPSTTLVGDLNGNGKVGLDDLVLLANAYNSKPGDPNWNPMADLASPFGIISLSDLVTLAMHYGQYNP